MYKRANYFVKGMCCARCVKALREELLQLTPRVLVVRIGEVELEYDEEKVSPGQIQTAIEDAGFEIMTLLKEKKIQEVKQYVEEHLADPEALHLSRLSRAVAVSPFHLSRTFSLLEGEGIKDFIIRKRMELAARLLIDTDQSVLDICMSVGLNSPSHFTRQFTQYYGRSPLAHRKTKGKPLPFPRKVLRGVIERLQPIQDTLSGHFIAAGGRHTRHA